MTCNQAMLTRVNVRLGHRIGIDPHDWSRQSSLHRVGAQKHFRRILAREGRERGPEQRELLELPNSIAQEGAVQAGNTLTVASSAPPERNPDRSRATTDGYITCGQRSGYGEDW